ncbi:MAG: InlB B-repeat-containing protein [Lachnospiraceae bacterium]|nr:InlB B-repeat-containing protein [Lachnospiraceae bacterium]
MKTKSRMLAIVMALLMIATMLPVSAFAENDAPATGTDIVVEELTNSTEEPTKETASPAAPGELPGTGEDKEQGENSGGEEKTAGSTPTPEPTPIPSPEPSKTPAKQAAPAQGADDETPPAAIFTVTFDANGHGAAPSAIIVKEGETITEPDAPTADGYTFTGWFRDPGAAAAWNFDADVVTGDITLYAGWDENPFVSLSPENNTTKTEDATSQEDNTTITDDNASQETTTTTVNDDTSQENNVTTPNNGTPQENITTIPNNETSQENNTVTSNETTSQEDVTAANNDEAGINEAANSKENDGSKDETTQTAPMLRGALQAQNAPLQNGGLRSGQTHYLTLRYDGSGRGEAGKYSGSEGTTTDIMALPGDGYRFQKWEIVSGDGKIDNPGAEKTTFTFGTTDTVVNAVFTEAASGETYTVLLYDLEKGTATATVDPGDPTTYTLMAVPAYGYKFGGWQLQSGSGTIQDAGAAQTTITNCTGRVEIIVHFGSDNHLVQTSVSPSGGGTAMFPQVDATQYWMNAIDIAYLKATPNAGYKFKEWRITSGAGNGTIGDASLAYTSLQNVTGDMTCEAVFESLSDGEYSVHVGENSYGLGQASASASYGSTGTEIYLTATPTRYGRFVKWEVKSGNVTINDPTSATAAFNIGSENVVIEAVFTTYGSGLSVSVTTEGGGSAWASSSGNVDVGERNYVYAQNGTGTHFSHWEVISGDVVLANMYDAQTYFIMGDKNVELKAVFVPEDEQCIRVTNDGNGEARTSVSSGKAGETVQLTATPNPGYQFKEWMVIAKSGGTLSSTTDNPAQFTIGTGHATIRATFAEDPYYLYAIVYHLYDGTNHPSNPATYTKSDTITLAKPRRDGHTFGGWYDNAAFNGSPVTEIPAGSSGDKQFFAKWTADIYNISYQNLKGASNSNPVTYTITDTPIPLVSPTGATGYTFDGWYDNAAFSGNAITEIPANSTGDKTFYAKWTADTYNISYQNVNGASNSNPATYTIADTPLTLAPLTGGPTGHTFDGWYDNASFSGSPITAIPAGITGDRTFYAKWTEITVTGITLNSDSANKIYTEGDALDVTGLTLEVSKSDGSKETVNVTAAMVTGFDSSTVGKQTLTVSYEGFTDSYEIEVKAKTNPPTPVTVSYAAKDGSGNTIQSVTWQKGSGKNLDLTFKRSEDDHLTYGLFGSLEIGGVTVGSANYSAAEGSLKLSVKPEYLETLSVGDHTVKVNFQDGSATVKLTVKAAASNPDTGAKDITSPKTGDESNLALWSSLMFLSVAAMVVLLLYARKRKIEK